MLGCTSLLAIVARANAQPNLPQGGSVVSGQAFIRNNDPQSPMGLLPSKRTPMLRLEVAP